MDGPKRSRPVGNRAASDQSAANLKSDVTLRDADGPDRCTRCPHPIHAQESLRIGMGSRCRRVVAA